MKTTRRILASLVAASFASVLAPAASYAADQVKIDGGILEGIMGTDPRVRLFISYSTWKWIEVQAKTGHAPVYRYRFDRVLPDPKVPLSFGAFHAVDIEYAFNTLDSKKADWQPGDRQTALTMATAFANFIKTGNPNGPGVPEWPEFGKTRQVMHLDGVSRVAPETDRPRYEFLDSVVAAPIRKQVVQP